jgi:hypothetical protein
MVGKLVGVQSAIPKEGEGEKVSSLVYEGKAANSRTNSRTHAQQLQVSLDTSLGQTHESGPRTPDFPLFPQPTTLVWLMDVRSRQERLEVRRTHPAPL